MLHAETRLTMVDEDLQYTIGRKHMPGAQFSNVVAVETLPHLCSRFLRDADQNSSCQAALQEVTVDICKSQESQVIVLTTCRHYRSFHGPSGDTSHSSDPGNESCAID